MRGTEECRKFSEFGLVGAGVIQRFSKLRGSVRIVKFSVPLRATFYTKLSPGTVLSNNIDFLIFPRIFRFPRIFSPAIHPDITRLFRVIARNASGRVRLPDGERSTPWPRDQSRGRDYLITGAISV